MSYTGFFLSYRFPIPDSRFPIPDSRFPIPRSAVPVNPKKDLYLT
ncbi:MULTISPECIES: hypothetical protein [unclassified Moorena]|nr:MULTISPECIES: hypothetical protein [unclassified Moorena]